MQATLQEKIVTAAQKGLPLCPLPFLAIADSLEIPEVTVLQTLRELFDKKHLRSLAPIYDTHRLEYDSALVAFQLPPASIEQAAAIISEHPGVSHNYERAHKFNLWFTLALPPDSKLGFEPTIAWLASQTRAEATAILPAKKTFKIGVKLDPKAALLQRETYVPPPPHARPLTANDRSIIALVQGPLPLDSRPFQAYAKELGKSEEALIADLRELASEGILRRIAAIPFHRTIGFQCNGMAVWDLPDEDALRIGPSLASFAAVSHCYLRGITPLWPHNLFAMIHAKSQDELSTLLQSMQSELSLPAPLLLISLREFKKQRIRYFSPELPRWEEAVRASASLL